MYVIREGLHRRWRFLAYLFAFFGLIGALPVFQANQLTQILREVLFVGNGWLDAGADPLPFNLSIGALLCATAGAVILGGLKRIAPGCRGAGAADGRAVPGQRTGRHRAER